MESLESKLGRLSPEQRKEVCDFIDFLLSRQARDIYYTDPSCNPLPVISGMLSCSPSEPEYEAETGAVRLQDSRSSDDRPAPCTFDETDAPSFHEIGGGTDGPAASDYMDYGRFEQSPAPARETAKKTGRRIIVRDGQETPRHLFDWVD